MTENLVLEHLRALRAGQDRIENELRDLKGRVSAVETGLNGVRRDLVALAEADARLQVTMDRLGERIDPSSGGSSFRSNPKASAGQQNGHPGSAAAVLAGTDRPTLARDARDPRISHDWQITHCSFCEKEPLMSKGLSSLLADDRHAYPFGPKRRKGYNDISIAAEERQDGSKGYRVAQGNLPPALPDNPE
jgi:hypothetical protein